MSEIMERTEWLAMRRTVVGGSDCAAALGESKWKTPYQLYLEKIGESETIETEPMRWGTKLEPLIRQEYANQTGLTIVQPGFMVHPTLKFIGGNVDGLIGDDRILEIKTARTAEGWGEPETDDIPDEYWLQCQHYLLVTGRQTACVAVLIGSSDFRVYYVEADREAHEYIIEGERSFWELVQTMTPPPVTQLADIKSRWSKSVELAVVASNPVKNVVEQLRQVDALAKKVEQRQDALKAVIQLHMKEADTLKDAGDNILATWKSPRVSFKFDEARFEIENPELHKKYLKSVTNSRRFLLKEYQQERTVKNVNRTNATKRIGVIDAK
jgi:putative phage-type endonuclease